LPLQPPPPPSDKEPSSSQKALLKKVKIGITVAVIVVISALILFTYFGLQKRGEVYAVDFKYSDHHPLFGSPYFHVEGSVFNSGERTAGDVELTIRLYDSHGTLLKTETMNIGDIPTKTYRNINIDIPYSGDTDRCETGLAWRPYGG